MSEAKYIQWVWRVLRSFDSKEKQEENEKNWVLQKDFAFVIEPKFWNISIWTWNWGEEWLWDWLETPIEPKNPSNKTTKISWITHLIESWEFDINYLRDLYSDLDEYTEVVTKEEVIKFFKEKTFDYWMSFNKKQINELKYKGNSIRSLSNLAWWNSLNNVIVKSPSGFQEFIAWIFGKEITKKINKITKEEVIEYFKTKWVIEYWLNLSARNIKKINYKNRWIVALVTISWWNNTNNVDFRNVSWFKEFISWIFFKKVEKITKGEVITFLKNKTYNQWCELPTRTIVKIKYKNKWIITLSTLAWWSNTNKVNIQTKEWFQEFIAWIFWITIEKKIKPEFEKPTQKKVLEYFKTTHSFDEWINFSQEQIREIDFKGLKIISLTTLSWWNNTNEVTLKNPNWFQKFIAWVFGKEKEILEKENITKNEIIFFFKTTRSYDTWISFTSKQINELKYKCKSINSLSSLTWWSNPNKVNLQTIYWFQEFIDWVFNKENPNKKV